MWISLRAGSRQLWVKDDQCYLANGELAFVNESIPTPLPGWLETPPESHTRGSIDERDVAGVLLEHRSSRAPAESVLAFYENCIHRGGLKTEPDRVSPGLPGRCCPGFSAHSADDLFLVNVYEWRDLAFWTVYLSHKNRRWKGVSSALTIVNQTPDRITLWIEHEKRECWAPASAVSSTFPGRGRRDREAEVMPQSLIPSWLRFSISDEMPTVFTGYPDGRQVEEWTSRILLRPDVDPYLTFEKWLHHLDASGFDATGASPNTYYLTVWQWGQMLSAQVFLGTEKQGSISLLNSEEKSITVTYVVRDPLAGSLGE